MKKKSTFQEVWYFYGHNCFTITKAVSMLMFAYLFYYFTWVIPGAPKETWFVFFIIPLFIIVKSVIDAAVIEQYRRRYDADYRWHLRYNRGERIR